MSTQENRARRAFEIARVLADSETGRLTRQEIWQAVVSRVPLEGDETEPTASSSMPRGEKNFQWSSAALVNAGYLIKAARGEWAITEAGRTALIDLPNAGPFFEAVQELSHAYQRDRLARREVAMETTIVAPILEAEAIRRVITLFVERGLRAGESVFSPGRPVWRGEVARELVRLVVDQPDVQGENFLAKLGSQLADASEDAKLLMAELVAWQVIPLQTPGEAKKRERITTVLNWMEHPVVLPLDIEAALRNWSFNPGVGLATRIWQGLCIMINTLVAWSELTDDDHARLLDDPWEWRELVQSVPGDDFPTQRNELLFLVHPETFGEIVSKDNRQAIRDAFVGELAAGPTDDIDQDLLAITTALQRKSNGPALYYREPLMSVWQPPSEVAVVTTPTVRQEDAEDEDAQPVRSGFPFAGVGLAARLHINEAWLDKTLSLIQRRQQVIFYGPPGTGKTYLARALAQHVTDATSGTTSIVQFHPTYSYEDFFEGFRPSTGTEGQQLGFALRRGPLRRLADDAAANPEANYFLVIDEINRGNLAKIFGELYYLLEYRDSEIALLYSEEPFTLPSNIFFIGTMNTADRSIAMLDAAMRRRFAFVELHPETAPVAGLLARWLPDEATDDRDLLLDELNRRIPDHDAKIGPSFLMRDLPGDELEGVWTYEILPLLAEYHYADGTDIEARYGIDALRRALRALAASDPAGTGDGDA